MFYIQDASILINVLKNMLLFDSFDFAQVLGIHGKLMLSKALLGLVFLFLYSFFNEFKQQDFIINLASSSSYKRWREMLFIVFSMLFLGSFAHEPFIYFEF